MSTQQEAQERAEKYLETDDYCNEDKPKDIARDAFTAGEISGHKRAMDEMSAKASEGYADWEERKRQENGGIDFPDFIEPEDMWQEVRAPLLAKIEQGLTSHEWQFNRINELNAKVAELEAEIAGLAKENTVCHEEMEQDRRRIAELETVIVMTNKVLLNAREEYRKELAEWERVGDEYSKLIDHCTRGLLSKASLTAAKVISVMEERRTDLEAQNVALENERRALEAKIEQWENDFEKMNSMRIEQAETLIRKVGDLEAQNKKLGDVVLEMAKGMTVLYAHERLPCVEKHADLIKQLKQERDSEG